MCIRVRWLDQIHVSEFSFDLFALPLTCPRRKRPCPLCQSLRHRRHPCLGFQILAQAFAVEILRDVLHALLRWFAACSRKASYVLFVLARTSRADA